MEEEPNPDRGIISITIRVSGRLAELYGTTPEVRERRLLGAFVADLLWDSTEGKGGISEGKAAETLGTTRIVIMALMKRWNIPWLVITDEELSQELKAIKKYHGQ